MKYFQFGLNNCFKCFDWIVSRLQTADQRGKNYFFTGAAFISLQLYQFSILTLFSNKHYLAETNIHMCTTRVQDQAGSQCCVQREYRTNKQKPAAGSDGA